MRNSSFLLLKKISSKDHDIRVSSRGDAAGFTLIEIMIVVVILSIAAVIAVPMLSSAQDVQLKAAANVIAADIEYAKSMAIGTGSSHSVVFNTAGENYKLTDSDGTTIAHPVKRGFDYTVDFTNDSRLSKVNIITASFGGIATVSFDSFGSPASGGEIVIKAGTDSITIQVEDVTGYVSIL